ncbi:MAG: hypothetical protein M1826_002248 [Phylliscum demangeonii]|nr:MAG: hypothetical protein M1826_002248 [Phylliscum demangeonii]
MFSVASPSRVPVPQGQVMVIARSDERADQAAWVSRLRLAHPAGCGGLGGPIEVGSYFDPETITSQGRGFLEGVLEELGNQNSPETKPAVVAAAALPAVLPAVLPAAAAPVPAIPSSSATASPVASPAGRRISVQDLFAAAEKAGGFMGLSGPPPVDAADAGASLPTPASPTALDSAVPPGSRRLSVEDLFAAANEVGGFMGQPAPSPVVAPDAGLVPTFSPASLWASVWAKAPAASSAPVDAAAAPAVGSARLVPARPRVSRWASIWAKAAAAGSAPVLAAAAPVAAFAALGAAPPTPPATPPRSPNPPATTKKTSKKTKTTKGNTLKMPPPEVNRPRKASKGKGGKKVKKGRKGRN